MNPDSNHEDSPERYRQYLLTLLRMRTPSQLQSKMDLSGIVQQTLLEAQLVLDEWKTWDDDRRIAWLRTALAHNRTDEANRFQTARRDVGREVSIDQTFSDSSARLEAVLAAEQSSPSTRASRNEELIRLANSLAQLLDTQRRAVELHHLTGLSIKTTAAEMGTTEQAVVGLLRRGLQRLRELMGASPP